MSRAFVKEVDEQVEDLPERPVSSAPNFVTPEGLEAIERELAHLHEMLSAAGDDRAQRASVSRALRYWNARRGSARVVEPSSDHDTVHFASSVTVERADGRREVFRIVGEDEAEPGAGTISHVSPLARALMGKCVGDTVRVANAEWEIMAIG